MNKDEVKSDTAAMESFFRWDEQMRMKAFSHCPIIPKRRTFCEQSGKCINRELINYCWERMTSLN